MTYKLLIDGALLDGDGEMDAINPATEEVLARCPRASKRQLDQAVANLGYCTDGFKAVLRRVLDSCGLLTSGGVQRRGRHDFLAIW